MSTRTWDVLPGHAPVLVDRWSTGHRLISSGAACGHTGRLANATVTQCAGWRIMPCPDPQCWQGRRPW